MNYVLHQMCTNTTLGYLNTMIFLLSNPGITNAALIMSYRMSIIEHSVRTLSFIKCVRGYTILGFFECLLSVNICRTGEDIQ